MELPLAKGKYRKPVHRMAMVFCYPSLPIWFAAIALFLHYDATRPNHPVPSAGRIYGQNNHGRVESEFIFSIEESPEGGYQAHARGGIRCSPAAEAFRRTESNDR